MKPACGNAAPSAGWALRAPWPSPRSPGPISTSRDPSRDTPNWGRRGTTAWVGKGPWRLVEWLIPYKRSANQPQEARPGAPPCTGPARDLRPAPDRPPVRCTHTSRSGPRGIRCWWRLRRVQFPAHPCPRPRSNADASPGIGRLLHHRHPFKAGTPASYIRPIFGKYYGDPAQETHCLPVLPPPRKRIIQ
jgi:hypothetical protein